jgi:hypothetical protein
LSRHRRCLGPNGLKAEGPSFESGGRLGMNRDRQILRCITNTVVTGYRTAEPSDSPPPASRYAQSHACRPTLPSKVPDARATAPPPRPRVGHALRPDELRLRRRGSGPRFKGPRGRKCARRPADGSLRTLFHDSGRSAASRVAYPAVAFACRSRWAFPLDPAQVGRFA